MPFLNPGLLWGLAFALLPILLLLLHRRRLVLHWAAYEWMRRAIVTRRRRIRITEWLKLISKILLLLAIALALLRPFLRRRGAAGDMLVVVDASPSMTTLVEGATRLERTRELLDGIVSEAEHPIAVYRLTGKLEPVLPAFTRDKQRLRAAVAGLTAGLDNAGARSFFDQLAAVPAWREARSVLFLGDFQNAWYGDSDEILRGVRSLGGAHPLLWHRVDSRPDVPNCAVVAVEPPAEGVFPNRPCELAGRIWNAGRSPSGERIVSLRVNGEIRGQVTVRLEPDEKRTVRFPFRFEQEGWSSVEIRLDPDALGADDAQMAALRVPTPPRLLFVAPERGEAPFPYDIYARAAAEGLFEKEQASFASMTALEMAGAELGEFDLMILVNLPLRRDAPYWAAVSAFLRRGGGVAAFLPARAADEAEALGLRAVVHENGGAAVARRLAGTYLGFMDAPDLKPENLVLNRCLAFQDVGEEEVRWVAEAGVAAVFRRIGRGRVAVFGFLPYPGYGNVQYNPNFVQIMLRLIAELSGAGAVYERTGGVAQWIEPGLDREGAYVLELPSGERRPLAVDGLGDDTRWLLPPDLGAGFHRIFKGDEEALRFALNVDPSDAPLEAAPVERFKAARAEGLYFSQGATSPGSLARVDLRMWMLIALAAAVAFEAYAHFLRKA